MSQVHIVVADCSPRFHSYSQTVHFLAESLEISQNQLPKKYSKNNLMKRKEENFFYFFRFCYFVVYLMLTKCHAYIDNSKGGVSYKRVIFILLEKQIANINGIKVHYFTTNAKLKSKNWLLGKRKEHVLMCRYLSIWIDI